MNHVIGELLPLALGVAISPIPIIAVILMLLAANARKASLGFLAGWIIGIVVATVVFVVVASVTDIGDPSSSSSSGSTTLTVLGVLLILLAARQWRGRPHAGESASLPGWLRAVDSFQVGRAAGLGFALAAINPKNLLLCAAAGVAIAQGDLNGGEIGVAVLVFTLLAASTVLLPVLGYVLAADRLRDPLNSVRGWLEQNNATVMAVLLLVIGVDLLGKGIGGF